MASLWINLYLFLLLQIPFFLVPCLISQRPLACEKPWQGLNDQCCREFLSTSGEILVKEKPHGVPDAGGFECH